MSEPRPSVVILAGPNGAGKSTVAPVLLHGALGVDEFVNADVIAQGLSAFEPDRVAIAAGRIMLARLNELAAQRADFAFRDDAGDSVVCTVAAWPKAVGIRRPSLLPLAVLGRPGSRACR